MHKMLSARPNINPPIVTTGVGPQDRHAIYLQPPEGSIPQFEDDGPGPVQPFSNANINLELLEEHQQQYRTFMDVIEAANAAQALPPPSLVQQLLHTHSFAKKENI